MFALDEPFLRPIPKRWIPREMTSAPVLDPDEYEAQIEPYYALLINPFYPKDANASFGKHVLTPTLALTSFAATTPAHWRVEYWDENLLDGRPPFRLMPQVHSSGHDRTCRPPKMTFDPRARYQSASS